MLVLTLVKVKKDIQTYITKVKMVVFDLQDVWFDLSLVTSYCFDIFDQDGIF